MWGFYIRAFVFLSVFHDTIPSPIIDILSDCALYLSHILLDCACRVLFIRSVQLKKCSINSKVHYKAVEIYRHNVVNYDYVEDNLNGK